MFGWRRYVEYVYVMTHFCLWHDSYLRATWLIPICDMTHVTHVQVEALCRVSMCNDSFLCVTWLISASDMTHFYVWHDFFFHACSGGGSMWSVRVKLRAKSRCIWQRWVTSQTWMSHVTYTHLSRIGIRHTYEWVMLHRLQFKLYLAKVSHVTHMNESYHTHECVTYRNKSHIWMSHTTQISIQAVFGKGESCHTHE